MKYDQDQYDWQRKAALMDSVSCKQYQSEDQLQADCVGWFNHYLRDEAYLAAVPNGGYRHKAEAIKLTATGVRKGFSDLICLAPEAKTYFLEAKNQKDLIDTDQEVFKKRIERIGFQYFMFNTFNQFRCLIQYILNIPNERFNNLV